LKELPFNVFVLINSPDLNEQKMYFQIAVLLTIGASLRPRNGENSPDLEMPTSKQQKKTSYSFDDFNLTCRP
jgi:hypothetical protein